MHELFKDCYKLGRILMENTQKVNLVQFVQNSNLFS